MKFRTKSRLIYLTGARHRGGHGIHSPFLYRLITTVIEDKRKLTDYLILKELKNKALKLLSISTDPSIQEIFQKFNIPFAKPRKLYRKIEMPLKYGKVVFRLIRELKPNAVINYGHTLGVNLSAAAMAQNLIPVYQVLSLPEYRLFCEELPLCSEISNIHWINEGLELSVEAEFMIINYPDNSELTGNIIHKSLNKHGDNDLLIVRGIHESVEMEAIWHELISSNDVRVSLDLFEIGIALFRKGLQKENFIHRF